MPLYKSGLMFGCTIDYLMICLTLSRPMISLKLVFAVVIMFASIYWINMLFSLS